MKKKFNKSVPESDLFSMEALKRNPFLVPEDYFSSLSQELQLRKRITELGDSCLQTPPDYQQQLTGAILARKAEQKLREQVPRVNPDLPADYFSDLSRRILSQTSQKKLPMADFTDLKSKRIIPLKSYFRSYLPYAIAASVLLFFGIFVFQGANDFAESSQNRHFVKIEQVPTQEIINYLALDTEPGDLLLISEQFEDSGFYLTDGFSEEDIQEYLEYSF